MRSVLVFSMLVALAGFTPTANAGDLPFSFTAPGGAINDNSIAVFPLTMESPQLPEITSLELDISGLSHTSPSDLAIYLIDPFGLTLAVMLNRGNQVAIEGVDLTFSDSAVSLPPLNAEIFSGTYLPEGAGGLGQYVGRSGGTDAWLLLIIDGSLGDDGSIDSYTLRGTFVPEPMTLTLLGIGALAALRRRRRA